MIKKIFTISLVLALLVFTSCSLFPSQSSQDVQPEKEEVNDSYKSVAIEKNIEQEEDIPGGTKSEENADVSQEKSIEKNEDVELEDEPDPQVKNTGDKDEQETAEENIQENDEESIPEEIEEPEKIQPTISLMISEGPLYTEDDVLCYYRIKAETQGYPSPDISFSRDDSNGAWGNNIAQINLQEGQSYELVARAENELGSAETSMVLEYAENKQSSEKQPEQSIVVDYSDIKNMLVDVNLTEQIVTFLYKDVAVREMICSGGMPGNPTPLGNFTTSQKIYYAWLPKYDVGVFHIVRFIGPYLFHSVPFDKQGNMIMEEYQKLGSPASHGCIRLSVEDARWLYETLPLGVTVSIHD